jgi:hypothetical protein
MQKETPFHKHLEEDFQVLKQKFSLPNPATDISRPSITKLFNQNKKPYV